MIYIYLQIIILWGVFAFTVKKLKSHIPEIINRNIKIIHFVVLLSSFVIAGSPVRLESTSITGKEGFKSSYIIVDKSEGAKDSETQNLQLELEKLKQQSKDMKNEIDN